jgi:hypothetical protein
MVSRPAAASELEPVQTGRVSGSQGRILKATNAVCQKLGFSRISAGQELLAR